MTRLQRLTLLKWGCYVLSGIALLVIQDVIMSQIRFSGATTDLPVAFILLVGLYEGLENGSVFTLAASLFYWFSGSAPTPICVAMLCILVILVGLFRQLYWHRSFASLTLCVSVAIMLYEMILFVIGLISIHFSQKIVGYLQQIQRFMRALSGGKFDVELSPRVLALEDELGDLAKSGQNMQRSLRLLVERDALTGLGIKRNIL